MSSVPSDAAQLDDFFERVSVSNPFLDNRINNPSARDVDVAEIHQTAFTRLTGLAREALAARRGVGVVLWGEAGVGKSHVLSRLGAGRPRKAAPISCTCTTSRPPLNDCRGR